MRRVLPLIGGLILGLGLGIILYFGFFKPEEIPIGSDLARGAESLSVPSVDNPAPEFELNSLSGNQIQLKDYRGQIALLNFWATWCAPCVKELPFFEKINTEYHNQNVEVILVSLDFPHLYESKLKPFIVEHHIKSKVIALDDVDMNTWIPLVNPDWSGSIPATIIYKNDVSEFYEQSFTYDTLENETLKFLNKSI